MRYFVNGAIVKKNTSSNICRSAFSYLAAGHKEPGVKRQINSADRFKRQVSRFNHKVSNVLKISVVHDNLYVPLHQGSAAFTVKMTAFLPLGSQIKRVQTEPGIVLRLVTRGPRQVCSRRAFLVNGGDFIKLKIFTEN